MLFLSLLALFTPVLALTTPHLTPYQIRCNESNDVPAFRGAFNLLTAPLRSATAWYIRPESCLKIKPSTFNVASWPTYANQTSIHLSGYVYASPDCAYDKKIQHKVFKRVLRLTGAKEAEMKNPDFVMPVDYLSWSVAGAHITGTLNGNEAQIPTADHYTGEYGPFDLFASTATIPAGGNVSMVDTNTLDGNKAHILTTDHRTGEYGHFDLFVRPAIIPSGDLSISIKATGADQTYRSHASKNHKVHNVSSHGVTIVCDLDDVLRVTEVWNPKQMLLNTFARPFAPWNGTNLQQFGVEKLWAGGNVGAMPKLLEEWNSTREEHDADVHFHYVSDAPEMSHQFYLDGIDQYYPQGSFDFRPMVFGSYRQATQTRYDNIKRLITTFPHRQVVLVGDTATPGLLGTYYQLAEEFEQVQCVFIRDVRATEPASFFAFDLQGDCRTFQSPGQLQGTGQYIRDLSKAKNFTTGCGNVPLGWVSDNGGYGKWAALTVSVWRGLQEYVLCHFSERPSPQCSFDRRELLAFPATGRRKSGKASQYFY